MPDIFLESPRFPGCPSAGFTSDPQYRVVITRRSSGVEKRNRSWTYPLTQLTVTIGPRAEDEIQEVLEFYHSVGGQAVGFRVKDYSDFKSCHVSFDPTANDQPLLATAVGGTYQLAKLYQFGVDQDGNPVTQYRPIYKPVAGTVLLSGAGSVDYETGLVTGSGGGTWGGEFDVPCRFDSGFPVEVVARQIQSVTFALVELRMSGAVG
jgi:uncharacterized protein (TIGR02217 family)